MNNNNIKTSEDVNEVLLTVKAVGTKFNISTRTVWRLVERGDLPRPVRIGRCCRWFEADILAVKKRLLEQRKEARGR